jgi:hypothetical protein
MKLSRRVRYYLRQLPAYRAVADWRAERRFRRWKARNPGATFADYYVARARETLGGGKAHYTLGPRGWVAGHGEDLAYDRDSFATRGLELWRQILDFGLKPDMRCVDYGCGSLRLGQHAMRYLEPGNYCGIDVTDSFIHEGLKLIDPKLLEEKPPWLAVIDDAIIAELRDWQPNFIFSNAVLQHVPPDELATYFGRLGAMMGPGAQAFILFIAAPKLKRVKAMNWAYPPDFLRDAVAAAAPGLNVELGQVDRAIRIVDGQERKVLRIGRPGA